MGCLEVSNRLLHALGLPPKARIADLLEALKDLGLPPESLTLDEDALAEHVELLQEGWTRVKLEHMENTLKDLARLYPEQGAVLYAIWLAVASQGQEEVRVPLGLAKRWIRFSGV